MKDCIFPLDLSVTSCYLHEVEDEVSTKDDIKKFPLRLPIEVHRKLVAAAKRDRRSLNAQIIHLIERAS
jgi:predicted HicB family RNase H-like nuclease